MGDEVNREKRYMVYFLSSEDSETTYRDWLCAGALISPSHVLTAAACLTDVSRLYVIAGYKKYVNGMDVDKDNCTRKRKRRVMRICIPRSYKLNYESVSDWMKIDIGIATVDEPYDFNDQTFRLDCSYPPNKIEVNYDAYLQKDDTNAIVMGWGSTKKYRQPDDILDYNSEYLRYARTRLRPINGCVKSFTNHTGAGDVIKEFMICSGSVGWFDIDGNEEKGSLPHVDGCRKNMSTTRKPLVARTRQQGTTPNLSERYKINDGEGDDFEWRRAGLRRQIDGNHEEKTSYENDSEERSLTKPGFCQNDHGAPLVTWNGPKEYVIGVASACIVRTETLLCMPPYLYTSTYCTGLFLQCVLNGSASSDVRRKCGEVAKENGIAIEDQLVTWPENGQDSESNKQQPHQQNVNDMRAEDYVAMEEQSLHSAKPALRTNEAVKTLAESESKEVATEVNNPLDTSKETTTEDYNPLEMIFNLPVTPPEDKIWIEQKTFATVTESEFDPYAILQNEFMEETVRRNTESDDKVPEAAETTENIDTQSDTPVPEET